MKLSWHWPHRHRLVYIGHTGRSLLHTYIAETDTDVYVSPRVSVNVWVALQALMYGWPSLRNYYRAYLHYVRPKFVVTFEDNALEFFLTREYHPSCTSLAIQNGRRDSFSKLPQRSLWSEIVRFTSPECAPSAIAVHGQPAALYYRTALPLAPTKIIATGNIRNNAIPQSAGKCVSTRPRLLFISSFPNLGSDGTLNHVHDRVFGYWQGEAITFGNLFRVEEIVAHQCAKLAQTWQMEFVVLGKRPAWQQGEYRYFENALSGLPWRYSPSEDDATSYSATAPEDVVVSVDSTLGYELLARGHRVAFICARMSAAGFPHIRDGQFAYPFVTEPKGLYWTDDCGRSEVERVVSFVSELSTQEWTQLTNGMRKQVMPYDPGNQDLCNLLTDLGIRTHGPRFIALEDIPQN